MERFLFLGILLLLHSTGAAQNPARIGLIPWAVTGGPVVDIAHCGDDRIFVVEQDGFIRIVADSDSVVTRPFLDISGEVLYSGENGLLGMVFDPDYVNNGFFYVNYVMIDSAGRHTHIARFHVSTDPDSADTASEELVYMADQTYGYHKGGDLDFGPDGNLYVPFGDGGEASDAQDLSDPLGDIVRIHPEVGGGYSVPPDNPWIATGPDTLPEIWASGLRNPFRFGFDQLTGDLWMGDVGQNSWEEVDRWPAGDNSGPNFGWNCYEGFAFYGTPGCPVGPFAEPVMVQQNWASPGATWCSVIGGRVYRGASWPHLYGRYFYTDYCAMEFRNLRPDGTGGWIDERSLADTEFGFSCIAEGTDGELYAGNVAGQMIYKIIDRCPMDPPTIIENGSMLESSTANAWQWFFNGDTIPGATGQVHAPAASGDFHVVGDFGNGCLLSSDTLSFIYTVTIGLIMPGIEIMPNPANDELLVRCDLDGQGTVRMIDLEGRPVTEIPMSGRSAMLNTVPLSAGSYLVQLMSPEGAVLAARRVVVAH